LHIFKFIFNFSKCERAKNKTGNQKAGNPYGDILIETDRKRQTLFSGGFSPPIEKQNIFPAPMSRRMF